MWQRGWGCKTAKNVSLLWLRINYCVLTQQDFRKGAQIMRQFMTPKPTQPTSLLGLKPPAGNTKDEETLNERVQTEAGSSPATEKINNGRVFIGYILLVEYGEIMMAIGTVRCLSSRCANSGFNLKSYLKSHLFLSCMKKPSQQLRGHMYLGIKHWLWLTTCRDIVHMLKMH